MNRKHEGRDLAPLEPGRADAGYWRRFELRVVRAAGPALARRREGARATLSDVMSAWSRILVPGAALAAAAAWVVLVARAPDGSPHGAAHPVTLETDSAPFLPGEAGADLVPSFLASESALDRDVVQFAFEGY